MTTAPEAPNSNSNQVSGPPSLGSAVGLWQTVNAENFASRKQPGDTQRELMLEGEARLWATVKTSDDNWGTHNPMAKGGGRTDDQLSSQATIAPISPQAIPFELIREPETSGATWVLLRSGSDTSKSTLVLNPRFTGALMGWPSEATSYESTATGKSRYKQHMRSLLSMLGWEVCCDV